MYVPKEEFYKSFNGEDQFLNPFSIQKNRLFNRQLVIENKISGFIYNYSCESFKIAYIKCKNVENILFKYKNDQKSLTSKFTLKGESTLISKSKEKKLKSFHHSLCDGEYIIEEVRNQSDFESITIDLDFNWFEKFTESLSENMDEEICFDYNRLFSEYNPKIISWQMIDTLNHILKILHPNFFNNIYLGWKVKELLLLQIIQRRYTSSPFKFCLNQDREFLERIIQFVQKNFIHITSVKTIYEQFDLPPAAVQNIVKSNLGISLKDYLTRVRMQFALEKLKQGTMNICEISYTLQYSTPNHFSRAFKNFYGKNPKDLKSEL